MRLPKKIKGVINPPGMEERKALLVRHGYARTFLDMPPPPGTGTDDFLDAAAMAADAGRVADGEAVSFPDPPMTDNLGTPVAIWA